MRIIGILLLVLGFVSLAVYVFYYSHSGDLIASSEMFTYQAESVSEYANAFRKRQLLVGEETHKKWLESSPVNMMPEDGPLKLGLMVSQEGMIKNRGLASPTYILLDAQTGQEVFRRELKGGHTPFISNHIGLSFHDEYVIADHVVIPKPGKYILRAGFVQWTFASSNLSITFEVMAHVADLNLTIIILPVGCMLIGAIIGLLTRPQAKNIILQ